jgi:hypothetical protein
MTFYTIDLHNYLRATEESVEMLTEVLKLGENLILPLGVVPLEKV